MRDVTLLSMKNKSVQNCRFVHHAKFHYIMRTLNKFFKIEFERWGGNWKRAKNLPEEKKAHPEHKYSINFVSKVGTKKYEVVQIL